MTRPPDEVRPIGKESFIRGPVMPALMLSDGFEPSVYQLVVLSLSSRTSMELLYLPFLCEVYPFSNVDPREKSLLCLCT